ncbi:UDP-N-acetylmuramoyl-tripeptide--D-alanyl-D-alanine ligase [Hazenella coriacea]|nr:UDP-N-acetylmuramoyl-tripeptide--D-alanyl-D-alanine ligase [Hazenella coriacea]
MERTCSWIVKATKGTWIGGPMERHLWVRGVSTDTRKLEVNQLYIPLVGERFDGHAFLDQAIQQGAVVVLWQKDHPLPDEKRVPIILVDDTLKALQRLAVAYRLETSIPMIAVTGSNGKTTTKDLLASVLAVKYEVHKTEGNLNNHIGVPLTLLSMSEQAEVAVIEMGMNHRGEIALLSSMAQPDFAVITNIGESHIEFLGSREGIAEAKCEVIEGLQAQGTLIYDGDEPLLRSLLQNDDHSQFPVGWGEENEESAIQIESLGLKGFRFQSRTFGTSFQLPLLGRHNVKNALFAMVVARKLGLTEEEIVKGLAQVQLSGNRLEVCQAINGMEIINDSYNASPTSMRAALDLLAEVEPTKEKWALLGDIFEIGDEEEIYHRQLGEYAINKKLDRLYTMGERGKWISDQAKKVEKNPNCHIHHFDTLEEAIKELKEEGNSNVLLLVKASRAVQLDQAVRILSEGA